MTADAPPEAAAGSPGASNDGAPHAGASEGRWGALLLSLVLGVAALALLLFLLAPLAPAPPDIAQVKRVLALDAFTNASDTGLQPEPVERFLYVCGVLLLPFCLGGACLLARRLQRSARLGAAMRGLGAAGIWLAAAALPLLLYAAGRSEGRLQFASFVPGGWLSLGVAAALGVGGTAAATRAAPGRARRLCWIASGLGVGVLLLGAVGYAAFREEHVQNVPIFWASFNAVFYSVVQVFFGRELTVDFVNQYGLYPHFLEPLFSVVGLSVFSFTLLMGILNALVFAALWVFLARETRNALVAFLGTASAFFLCYAYAKVGTHADYYFQYNPLRTVFPALLLLAAGVFAHRPRRWMPAALGALGAAAALWVPDSGIIVLASGFLFVGYDALARRRPRALGTGLLQAAAAAGLALLVFGLLLRVRFGSFPDYSRFFLYPKAFYLLGNFMIPMPYFGLWVPVALVYAVGLLRSLCALIEGEDRPRDRLHFLLAVLGLGLFTYYQGRSVLGNLAAAAYPAVLLLSLFAAELLEGAPRAGRAPRVLLFSLLTLLSFSLPALATIAPEWRRAIEAKMEASRGGEVTEVLRDARFLQQHLRRGEKVVIISYQSALFHLLTGTTNPLDIPGDSELSYRADFDKQTAYAYGRRGTLAVDKSTMSPEFVATVRRLYPNRFENPSGRLMVLRVP